MATTRPAIVGRSLDGHDLEPLAPRQACQFRNSGACARIGASPAKIHHLLCTPAAARARHAASPNSLGAATTPDYRSIGAGPVGQPSPDTHHRRPASPAFTFARGGGAVVPMAISPRRAGAARLRETIQRYRVEWKDTLLNHHAHEVLTRLAKSSNAARAFDRLKLPDIEVGPFLHNCIVAERLARTFPKRIAQAIDTIGRAPRLEKAVAELRRFVDEVARQKRPPPYENLTSWIFDPPANIAAMSHGLDLIARRIDTARLVSKKDLAELGATRKTQIRPAPEIAAIWFLARYVEAITGKPHRPDVAQIAQAVLKSKVSEHRVRHAMRQDRSGSTWAMFVEPTLAAARKRPVRPSKNI